jgi:hypothetical protein
MTQFGRTTNCPAIRCGIELENIRQVAGKVWRSPAAAVYLHTDSTPGVVALQQSRVTRSQEGNYMKLNNIILGMLLAVHVNQ